MWREKLQIHKANPIAALHPSCKFLVVCLYSFCALFLASFRFGHGEYALLTIPWFLIVPALAAASGILKKFWHAFTKVLFIAVVIFVVQALLIVGGETIWQLWIFKIRENGLNSAIYLSFCVMNIAGIFVWFFQTTENKEISCALEDSGMNYKATYVFISTLQMIDVLGQNSRTIMNAQQARGVETDGNLIVRSKAFFASLVPLILGAITSTEERVLTLESKGFDVNCKKTRLFQIEKTGNEKTVNIISIIITVIIVVWRVVLWIL